MRASWSARVLTRPQHCAEQFAFAQGFVSCCFCLTREHSVLLEWSAGYFPHTDGTEELWGLFSLLQTGSPRERPCCPRRLARERGWGGGGRLPKEAQHQLSGSRGSSDGPVLVLRGRV